MGAGEHGRSVMTTRPIQDTKKHLPNNTPAHDEDEEDDQEEEDDDQGRRRTTRSGLCGRP